MYKSIKIEGIVKCITPLSHIGEVHSTGGFFNTEEIIIDGNLFEVYFYSANALRGMLRRYASKYFCENLNIKLNEDWYAKMFFGGGSNSKAINLELIKNEREFIPVLSIFGYGLGIMKSKLCTNDLTLICEENKSFIPSQYHTKNIGIKANDFIGHKEYTRVDSFKDDLLSDFLLTNTISIDDKTGKRKINLGESTSQMRFELENIKSGSDWYLRFDLTDLTDIEIGVILSSIYEWMSQSSRLGGNKGKGYGLVKLLLDIDIDNNKTEKFLYSSDKNNKPEINPIFLKYIELYNDHLKEHSKNIIEYLEAKI